MRRITALNDLAIEHWPLDRLLPYAANARTHSDDQVAQIAGSIAAFGFNVPCLVDERGVLIAGHGRLLAARQLELETVRRRSPPTVCSHVALRAPIGPLHNTPPIFSRPCCLMPSGIHTPGRQARNPAAMLGLPGSTAAAASAPRYRIAIGWFPHRGRAWRLRSASSVIRRHGR